MENVLSDVQLRRINITLRRFEKDLRLAQRIMDGQLDQGFFYQEVFNIPLQYEGITQQLIQKALAELSKLREQLQTPVEVDNHARTLRSYFQQHWVDLSTSRIKNKEHPDPAKAEALATIDQSIQKLEDIAFQLGNLFALGSE